MQPTLDSSIHNEEEKALLTYLRDHAGDVRDPSIPGDIITPDFSDIPPALAEIASTTTATYEPPRESSPLIPSSNDRSDRGEMGGKRRKPVHMRAGWLEMEQDGTHGRKIRDALQYVNTSSGAGAGTEDVSGHDGEEGITTLNQLGVGTLEEDLAEARVQMGLQAALAQGVLEVEAGLYPTEITTPAADVEAPAILPEQTFQEEDEGRLGKKAKISGDKDARAEQNRRAQQAFRRRREEHIKKLEADSLALEPTRKRLDDVEDLLRDANLSLEASNIENAALRATLLQAIQSGISILTPDGTLAINASMTRTQGNNSSVEVENACIVLARQALQLARVNRAKREHGN